MPVNPSLAAKTWYRYAYARDNGHALYVDKANQCESFFKGDQWTTADVAKLKASRRPALTINKIISTIGNVMGEQIYNRSEISFRPKTGASDDVSDVLTKVFKQISDNNQLDWRRSDMFADGIITSRGFLDIRMDFADALHGEVRICNINPKNVIIDNDADEHDPDSWNEVMVTKWMTADDIAILYNKPDAELLRNRQNSYFPYGFDAIDTFRDRFGEAYNTAVTSPLGSGTNSDYDMSPVMRNVRVIERQHRVMTRQNHFINVKTGDTRPVPDSWDANRIAMVKQQFGYEVIPRLCKRIRWTVISDNIVLHDEWSPYKHFSVVPYFPYFRRGSTIGLVENLIGPQELLNKVSSQELHVVNTTANSGWKVKTGALTNMSPEELEARGAESGIVLEVNGDPDKDIVKITPNSTPTGLDRISYKAEEHIKTISGVSDSQQGMDREDVAAKAIQAKRQAASTNLAKPMDSLVRTDFMIARNVLDLVQSFYTEERVMTIAHTAQGSDSTEQITINQVTPEGTVVNDLSIGEYEVTISSVPQRETLEDSQFEQAVTMRKDLGVQIPDEFIIRASRLLGKNALIKTLQEATQSPEAQAAKALEVRGQTAEVGKTEAEIEQKKADAILKQTKSQKEGITAQKDAMTPIETEGGEGTGGADQAAIMKAEAEIALDRERFEMEREIKMAELELKKQESAQKQKLATEDATAKQVAARVAAAQPAAPAKSPTTTP